MRYHWIFGLSLACLVLGTLSLVAQAFGLLWLARLSPLCMLWAGIIGCMAAAAIGSLQIRVARLERELLELHREK